MGLEYETALHKPCSMCREAPASIASAAHAAFSIAALTHCAITMGDFETAIPKVQPSVRREGFATTPDVTWADVGALPQVCGILLS